MHLSFAISPATQVGFLEYWASKYHYPDEQKYTENIGKPLTEKSLLALFKWKNGRSISKLKTVSISTNYELPFRGNPEHRYLNHDKAGGAIWNIFFLHCLDPKTWPIFDQHTFRAMRYLQTGTIVEIGTTKKQQYVAYESYRAFLKHFEYHDQRFIDKALFSFGRFLKLAAPYVGDIAS
jgi:hypothetical protein